MRCFLREVEVEGCVRVFDVLDVDVRGGGMCLGRDDAAVVVVDVALVVEDDVEEGGIVEDDAEG